MRSIPLKSAVFFVMVATLGCSSLPGIKRKPASENKKITVVALTDMHGALEAEDVRIGTDQSVRAGGAEALSAYVQTLRESSPDGTVVVDGGDLFQGTMLSNQFEGAPVIKFYNYLGVDAAALGNHEFDFGPEGDKAVPRDPSDDAQGALKRRVSEARFPILAVNVRDASGKIPDWVKPSVIKDLGGVKIGIIGISDPKTPSTTNALNLVGLEFVDPLEPIVAEATRLREQEHVDAIVLAAHLGGICADNSPEKLDDLSSCTAKEIFELVAKLPKDLIQVVVAGHTHRTVVKRVGSTLILQAGSSGKYVGWATLESSEDTPGYQAKLGGMQAVCTTVLETTDGLATCDSYLLKGKTGTVAPATFLGKPVTPDLTAARLYAKEARWIAQKKAEPVGVELKDDFIRAYGAESALGNLMADLQRDAHPEAEIGMANGGGLRANLAPGPLVYDRIFALAPFDNQLALVRVTGAQLEKMVEIGASGKHGAYLFSSEVRFELERCKPKNITVNGNPVDPTRVYTIAMSDYMAGGGSGIKDLALAADAVRIFWDKEYLLRDAMVRVLKKWNRPLSSKEFFDPENPRQKIVEACPAS